MKYIIALLLLLLVVVVGAVIGIYEVGRNMVDE